jgi:putative flippase GtrA
VSPFRTAGGGFLPPVVQAAAILSILWYRRHWIYRRRRYPCDGDKPRPAPADSSRGLSFSAAVAVAWALNRSWTFCVSARPSYREFLSYLTTQAVGLGSNFSIYSALTIAQPSLSGGPIVALGIVCLCALGINYAGMRLLVFARPNPKSSTEKISNYDAADNDGWNKGGQEDNSRHR